MEDAYADTLMPELIRLLIAMKSDRPPAWSASFEGLSPIDLHVLGIADTRPDVILGEIRLYLDVPNSTLTGIVDRLEGRGLVERVISARDRRSYGLKLTEKGRELREEQRCVRRRWAALMLAALDSDAEREAFVTLVSKIAGRIDKEAV